MQPTTLLKRHSLKSGQGGIHFRQAQGGGGVKLPPRTYRSPLLQLQGASCGRGTGSQVKGSFPSLFDTGNPNCSLGVVFPVLPWPFAALPRIFLSFVNSFFFVLLLFMIILRSD